MAEPYEVSDPQAPVEPQPGQIEEAAPPVAEPAAASVEEEFVPYRRGDQEIPLPITALRQVAEALGFDNPAAIVNQLRNGEEAQEIYKQARNIYQQAKQRPQYQPPPVDERWNQHLQAQQQYRPQAPQSPQGEPDPLQLLSEMHREVLEMKAAQQARQEWEMQRETARIEREANQEYAKFVSELKAKKIPDWKIPDRDYLLREAEMLGMFHGDTGIGDMYRNVYRMTNAEFLAENAANSAVQNHVERLRDPKARVTVPVARPAPQPTQTGNPLDSMKIGDVFGTEFKI